ncbi:MAG: histidine kinase [Rudanella sp.]|nr:histidine kinase [Rudanella sp.]
MKRFACFCFLWLLASLGQAQSGQGGPIGEVPLQGKLYRLVDSTGQLIIQQITARQRAGQFRPSTSQTNRQDFGYNETAVHWLFFELDGLVTPSKQAQLMLEIEYANLDELQLYAVSDDSPGSEQIKSLGLTGDRFQYRQRPYQNNNYVFPIRLSSVGQKTGYFLRVKQPHAILSFFIRLWHRPAFVSTDRNEYFAWGMFIGIVIIVAMLSLVLLLALRDWIYWWYNLYLHFITMHLFTDAGLSFQYLWPTVPRLNEFSPVYLYVWAAMVCQTTFMQYFIHQNRHNSQIFKWVNAFKIVVTVALTAAIMMPLLEVPGRETYMYQAVSLSTSVFVPVIVMLTILSLTEANRRSRLANRTEPMVRYYGYALAVQFTGYLLVAIMNFCQSQGWPLPFDVETYVVLGLTVLADLVFFTYGLAYRYSHAQEHNQQLALNLLKTRQDAQQQVIASLQDEHCRLAQDLHDDVGPLLATTKGYLSRLARTDQTPPLQQAQTLLDEAADELRTLSHQLLPPQLAQTGLVNAIAEATRKLSRRGVPVQFVSMGAVRPMGGQQEQLFFSMATQLIRNAQRHAGATDITVQLLYHDDQVNLSVEDDGLPAQLPETDAANLRAKADLLKAELLNDSTEAGNSVMVSILMPNLTAA